MGKLPPAVAAATLNGFLLRLRDLLRGVRVLIAFQTAAWLSLWMPQGSEVYVMEARSLANLLSLSAACLIFAACLFVCARAQIMPSLRHVATPIDGVERFRSRLPAFMSGLFLFVAAVLVWRGLRSPLDLADDPTKGLMILKMGPLGGCAPVAFGAHPEPGPGSQLQLQLGRPGPRRALAVLTAMAALFASLSVFAPVRIGQGLGPHAVLLLAAAFWMVIVTACRIAWKGRPWVKATIVAAFVAMMLTDSHEIRTISAGSGLRAAIEQGRPGGSGGAAPNPEGQPTDARSRPTDVRAAYQQFRLQVSEMSPMVIVSTAGGGLRAAYWTATVLGELQDEHPEFGRHLFAISAVSGGALGAAVFDALLERSRSGKAISCITPDGNRAEGFRKCGQAVLRNDFLSPVLLRLTVSDPLPVPFLPDRAVALEQAWEQAWSRAFPDGSPGLDDRFGFGDSRIPVLVLNGVSATDGARLVTATVNVSDGITNLASIVPMRLSTAANNSARFPIIEPAGSVVDLEGNYRDAVVDGGYVENFGADSALDILHQVMFETEDDRNLDKDPRPQWIRKIIMLQISSDPELDLGENISFDDRLQTEVIESLAIRAKPAPIRNYAQLWAPLAAVLAARTTQGNFTERLIDGTVQKAQGSFFHFRLWQHARHEPPLSWALASQSFEQIGASLRRDNADAFDRLGTYFPREGTRSPSGR